MDNQRATSSFSVGTSWRDTNLDETMEQIFHPSSDRFSISDFRSEDNVQRTPHYDENDYKLHRVTSLHHHQPLHKLHHRHKRSTPHKEQDIPLVDMDETAKYKKELKSEVEEEEEEESVIVDEGDVQEPLLKKSEKETIKTVSTQSLNIAESKELPEDTTNVHFTIGSSVSLEKDQKKELPSSLQQSLINLKFKSPIKSVKSSLDSSSSVPEKSGFPSPSRGQEWTQISKPKATFSYPSFYDSNRDGVFDSTPKPKVKFVLGEETSHEEEDQSKKHYKDRNRHHKRHRSHETDLSRRQHSGSCLETKTFNEVLEPEEAESLQTADIDDLASHRFEDPKAFRRHKIQAKSSVASFIRHGRKGSVPAGDPKSIIGKKLYDHQPHEIFVELDELLTHAGEEWQERARWIKYEEDFEELTNRWGKPHVASLSFHSLLNLRQCLEQGSILLDLEEKDLNGIVNRVVENMIISDQIKPDNRGAIMKALLLRHRHAIERSFEFSMRRNSSGYGNLNMMIHDKNKSSKLPSGKNVSDGANGTSVSTNCQQPETKLALEKIKKDCDSPKCNLSSENINARYESTSSIFHRIPQGAEATLVLVGALSYLESSTVAFVRLAEGTIMPNLIEVPVPMRFLFILLGPVYTTLDYREIGRSMGTLMSNRNFNSAAYRADERKDLLHAINEFLDDSIVLPPGDWQKKSLIPINELRKKSEQLRQRKGVPPKKLEDVEGGKPFPDPLKRTKRCFGGLVNDVKRRYPYYLSDIKDALNVQCIASVVFIYFAALSGAITFGGLLADKTDRFIGVPESLIITSIGGVIFSLFSGQPLIIVGVTGPVMLFDEIVYTFCKEKGVEFLPLRVWISFWVAFIATVFIAFEGSTLCRYFTRFTQEIFFFLIALLFIYESFHNLYSMYKVNPLVSDYCDDDNSTNSTLSTVPVRQPNTALMSTMLTIMTFCIANYFRTFRQSKYLGRLLRRILSDFGVPIALITAVIVDFSIKHVYTQKLSVPDGLKPTKESVRGWFISPLGLHKAIAVWHVFAALLGAILIFILLFLEVQITQLIVNKEDRKLKKGAGFHLDILIICYMTMLSSMLGGPWLSAATVRSVSHIVSLTVLSKTHAPGETPHIVDVKEQRITNLIISLIIGISVTMAPLLQKVPIAVLFGVFLYMGISSLTGIQFYERVLLLLIPAKHHPDVYYVRQVQTGKMHAYTIIQIFCFAILWGVKSTAAAIAFPFVLLSMMIVRHFLKCCFTKAELEALDGDNIKDDIEDDDGELSD